MNNKELANIIDHTLLKADATNEEIVKLCAEAKEYNFASVCVNPSMVKLASEELKDCDVDVCTVIGFPLGATTSEVKAFETKNTIENGATEVDMVINIGNEKFMGIELSDGTSYSLYGAGNADVTVKLWGYVILAMSTMFSISRAYKHLRMKSIRKVIGDIMIVPVYLILLAVVLALYQLIYVASNTLATNEKYIDMYKKKKLWYQLGE